MNASTKHQGTLLYPEVPVSNLENLNFFVHEDKIVLLPIPENSCQVFLSFSWSYIEQYYLSFCRVSQ